MISGVVKVNDWVTRRRTLSFEDGPKIMGILNVTPDSFSDGGRFTNLDSVLDEVEKIVADGADIIDIGGESTRPKGTQVSVDIELQRVVPVVESISRRFDIAVSVDTSKAGVAKEALDSGADIVNDISGLRFDPEMARVAAAGHAGVVLMHVRGDFESMHETAENADIVEEVTQGLRSSMKTAREAGITDDRICLDVGIGFGKTQSQNLLLLRRLKEIMSGFPSVPMLIGVSRKSFIGRIIGETDPSKRLAGTIAANCEAVAAGANILRVHDVKAASDALKVIRAIRNEI